ncbi:other/AgaK1 protein kinase [Ephemerocybe angulata]|uniref:Other/AgaK1 protein kinase n=1 Tax=Ephemerocybe angulata TaxID=980116 RepID=A0A8H6HWT5_9AGAR|nr:other/AgaK1 protein kinase [Tulosesus angulatus]
MRVIKLDSFISTVQWTIRSWKEGYPLTNDVDQWVWTANGEDLPAWAKDVEGTWARWKFLSPFFASHGIYIYELDSPYGKTPARPPLYPKPQHFASEVWPWPRRAYKEERELDFDHIQVVRVWAARDANGRELVLRLASGHVPTDELKAFQRLNTAKARSDSRNHTLPILKYLTFDGLVFAVMPRWAPVAFSARARASKVAELVHLAEVFYEGMEFLHENRIAHRDHYPGNAVLNALTDDGKGLGLRVPGEVRYAYIDFGAALVLPMETDIDTVLVDREMRIGSIGLGLKPGVCNPFKDDVLLLTRMIQSTVRVIENVVPEIGAFFDNILQGDYASCPSATEALIRFRKLQSNLSQGQLDMPPSGIFWRNGRVQRDD